MGITVYVSQGCVEKVTLDGEEISYRLLDEDTQDDEGAKALLVSKLAEWIDIVTIANVLVESYIDYSPDIDYGPDEPLNLGNLDNAFEACKKAWLRCCGDLDGYISEMWKYI